MLHSIETKPNPAGGDLFRARRARRNGVTNWYSTEQQAVDALKTPRKYNPEHTGRVREWKRVAKAGWRKSVFTNAIETPEEKRKTRKVARKTRALNRKRHKAHRWGKHY